MIYEKKISSLYNFISCDYLDVSISSIHEAIFNRANLSVFEQWDKKTSEVMEAKFRPFSIYPEADGADTLIMEHLKLLRLEYRKRILTTSSQESLCCSFFSSSERLQRPLKEKIAAIEQLLDEINGRELYLSDINQTVID